MSERGVVLGEGGGGGGVGGLRGDKGGVGGGGGWGGWGKGGVLVGVLDVGGDECGSMYGRDA